MALKIEKIVFKTNIEPLFPEQFKALQEAQNNLKIIEGNILDLYEESPRRQAAYDLASENRGSGNRKSGTTSSIVGHQIFTETSIDIEKPVQSAHIDAPTANLLLNGKLLTPEEKRKLLKKIGLEDILEPSAD